MKRLEEQDDLEAHDAVELLKMFSFLHCEDIRIEFLITAAVNPRVEQELRDKDKEVEDRMKVFARPKTWGEYTKEMVFNMAEAATRERAKPCCQLSFEILNSYLRSSRDSDVH